MGCHKWKSGIVSLMTEGMLSFLALFSTRQICGYVSAIRPTGNDDLNLISFRFSALNPIVDPWIFILFRKSVFRHLRQLLRCRFPGNAVKATAHTALSLPLEVSDARVPASATLQAKAYASLPQQ